MKGAKLFACLIMLLLTSGCWGSKETDDIAYVLSLGFDKGPGDKLLVTFQIANPIVIAGQSGGGGRGGGVGGGGGGGGGGGVQNKSFLTMSAVAELPIGALHLLNSQQARELSLLHTMAFIFSDELAREGLKDYINSLNRYRETRGSAFVYICRGKAKDFLEKNTPMLELSPAKQYELLFKNNKLHGLVYVTTFREFYQKIKYITQEPVAPLLAINKEGLDVSTPEEKNRLGDYLAGELPSNKNVPQFLGSAVFKGDKMIGEITGDETRYLNIMSGLAKQTFLIIRDPQKENQFVGLTIKQAKKPKIKVDTKSDQPVIDLEIFLEPNIVGISSGINYESVKYKPILENELENIIKSRCEQLIKRTQDEFTTDIAGFGRIAAGNFLTIGQWEKYKWEEKYPRAVVNIKVNAKIRRTGFMIKTMPVHY
ncbi:MAG: Ger(x)C family spore germination protein [Bacillota bacterium]